MSSASFTLSITATVRAADAPLDDVISFSQAVKCAPIVIWIARWHL